jgi:hypothetical protein
MAVLDALEGARRLHAALHTAVTGQPPRHRSYAQTGRTIVLIAALGAHASRADAEQATRIVFALAAPLRRLPAVDLDERWRKVSGVACRYCGTPMLRLGERSGTVTCLRWGACWDGDGRHPVGFLAHGVGGEPMIAWNDGTNEYADVVPATGGTEAVP